MVKLSTTNPRYEDVPLNVPPFEWSSDLSYWDASMGAVSDSNRKAMWLSLTILDIMVTIIIGFVLTSILIKSEVRRKPYNLFLIFLMIPDIIFSAAEPPIYIINYLIGKYVSVEVCKFQAFIVAFGVLANCQINALIALEIHRMLRDSYDRKRYFPPNAGQVLTRCLASFIMVGSVALTWALNFENLPVRVFLTGGGTFCSPGPYDTRSALAYYLGLISFGFSIPFGICGMVTLDVLKRGLLPEKGEGKRALVMFFFRLLLVFLVFWTPTLVAVVVSTNPWFAYIGGLWAHSQGAVSAIAMLGKGDVRKCVIDLLAWVSCGLLSFRTDPKKDKNPEHLSHTSMVQGITDRTTKEMDDFTEVFEDAENPYLQDADDDTPPDPLPTVFENEPYDRRES